MKYKYCPSCQKAYVKSRIERDECIYCGKVCEVVDVKRNRLYYVGYGVMMAGAGSVLYPRFDPSVSGPTFYIVMGIVLAFGGAVLVMMGSVGMAKSAAEMVKNQELENDAE